MRGDHAAFAQMPPHILKASNSSQYRYDLLVPTEGKDGGATRYLLVLSHIHICCRYPKLFNWARSQTCTRL